MTRKLFNIGSFKPKSPFLLAPLAGITDKAMRSLCAKQGASLVYTEMASAKGLVYGDRKSRALLDIGEDEEFVAYQIFGCEPKIISQAMRELKDRNNVLFDLNVGCPVPKIVKNGEGSALLKKLDLLYDIIKGMKNSTDKPVTAKIRKGFERDSNTAVETAKTLEAAGVDAITVHGRTREQYYEGKADWQVIADVKAAVSIPIIGNGDVFSGQDAVDMIERTGCDGVMIARGALGNPWIFREAAALWNEDELPPPPTDKEKIEMLIEHLDKVIDDKGERIAVREIRKHVGWYIKGLRGAAALRRITNNINDVEEMKRTVREVLER